MGMMFGARTGVAGAVVLAAGLLAAGPAAAQSGAGEVRAWCNPVYAPAWGNAPVRTSTEGYGVHQGSYPRPPAAAAPAPAPAVQNEYLVFFDWDKANVTPAADNVISDAVAAARQRNVTSFQVIGHTDTSGSPAYNQRLSERRAQAVKNAMVAKGVPANAITTRGVGENQLLVPTGPNVREPSNRRAQIIPRTGTGPTS